MALDGYWDEPWVVFTGCTQPLSEGCGDCYAARLAGSVFHYRDSRLYGDVTSFVAGKPVFNGTLRSLPPSDAKWLWPLTWSGAEHPLLGDGEPSLIFATNMGEFFLQPRPVIDRVVGTLALSQHIGLLLTKLPAAMLQYFSEALHESLLQRRKEHLWLGISAETQFWFDKRWQYLRPLALDGWTTFVSLAPVLGPITLPPDFLELGPRTWVIVAAKEGPHPQRMDLKWARRLRAQCREANIPFFVLRGNRGEPLPDDLRVREVPKRAPQKAVRRAAVSSPAKMLIAIPSKGRADNQITLASLRTAEVLDRTIVCVEKEEADEYAFHNRDVEIVVVPDGIVGISAKRRWILTEFAQQRSARYVAMADDDLTFCRRLDVHNSAKLETMKDEASLQSMLATLERWLVDDKFVHVGLSARYMNMTRRPFADATRMLNFCAYDCLVLAQLVEAGKIELGRVPLMEDFDLTLQLLRLGHLNRVSHEFCCDQTSNAPGGCSTYRTPEMQAQAAELLAELHPGLVRVVTRRCGDRSPAWRGMKQRREVAIQWKKAAGLR